MPKNEITEKFEEMMVKEYGVEFVDVTPEGRCKCGHVEGNGRHCSVFGCICPAYRPPTTEPADDEICKHCGTEFEGHDSKGFCPQPYESLFESSPFEPAESEGKRVCHMSLPHPGCPLPEHQMPPTAPPEDALEDARQFIFANSTVDRDATMIWFDVTCRLMNQYAAKLLAERDNIEAEALEFFGIEIVPDPCDEGKQTFKFKPSTMDKWRKIQHEQEVSAALDKFIEEVEKLAGETDEYGGMAIGYPDAMRSVAESYAAGGEE